MGKFLNLGSANVAWVLGAALYPTQAEGAGAPVELSDVAQGIGGFVITSSFDRDKGSGSLAAAGDVNGDGLADLIAGSRLSDVGSRLRAGRSHVIFGKTSTTPVNVAAIENGIGGFVINGAAAFDESGKAVSGAGDVNGDGLADLIIGAPMSNDIEGGAYVVFGRTLTTPVKLASVANGVGGFAILNSGGSWGGDYVGHSVAGAGDVNGDGLADVVVGAPDDSYQAHPGFAYVVFGKSDTQPVELSSVASGTGGFVLRHSGTAAEIGHSVAGAGDVNGDGFADLLVGGPRFGGYYGYQGISFVVFGKSSAEPVELSRLAADQSGFVIQGESVRDFSGSSVAGAGDVNGDGLADLIVAAPGNPPGRSFVVFGKTSSTPVPLSAVAQGSGGFLIQGEAAPDATGASVTGAGDVNGDGLADLLVGARLARVDGSPTGRSYVVWGRTGTSMVDLSAVATGQGGFPINGHFPNDHSGASVASADINGDGLVDLVVGGTQSSHVVFGATSGAFADSFVDQLGGSGDDAFEGTLAADVLVGGAGHDTLDGAGAADVLHGGSGDDVLIVHKSHVKALGARFGAGGNTLQLARLDGGTGFDTLKLAGAKINLDLAKVADQGGSTGSRSRIESVERIDLTGNGNNTVLLGSRDIRDMAGMNIINSSTQAALGWANGTYVFPSVVRRHQLVVAGDSGDTADLSRYGSRWTVAGTAFQHGVEYTVYNSDTGGPRLLRTQVLVATAVTSIAPPPGTRLAKPARR